MTRVVAIVTIVVCVLAIFFILCPFLFRRLVMLFTPHCPHCDSDGVRDGTIVVCTDLGVKIIERRKCPIHGTEFDVPLKK